MTNWVTPFTSVCNVNRHWTYIKNIDPSDVKERIAEGTRHLHFIVSLYQIQLDAGLQFLHEHPAGTMSWADSWMNDLLQHPRVKTMTSDLCEYGLVTPNAAGVLTPAKKLTLWVTTSEQMKSKLQEVQQDPYSPTPGVVVVVVGGGEGGCSRGLSPLAADL